MAKQTFTTGQVLTAAQMTSLQQTAMLGGAASAKTASYTLVAADAGTAISMSNASATTITVNTALFAAGDTVQITNLGTGVCTITAGTATVNTSASLALAQYESGTLDFTSTSAAIFIKGAGAAAASGSMTLLSTTTLSGTSTTISSIDSSYSDLIFYVYGVNLSSSNTVRARPNGSSTETDQAGTFTESGYGTGTGLGVYSEDIVVTANNGNTAQMLNGNANNFWKFQIYNYASASTYKVYDIVGGYRLSNSNNSLIEGGGIYRSNTAISSMTFVSPATFNAGTVKVYGVK